MQVRRNNDRREGPTGSSRHDGNVVIELEDAPLTTERAEQYQDWVARMRRKRESDQEDILGSETESPTYWRSEDVFNEDTRLGGDQQSAESPQRHQMLAVLGLSGDATPREIETAFRRLAWQHHPDRHIDADDETTEHHLQQMRRLNEAYTELRRRCS